MNEVPDDGDAPDKPTAVPERRDFLANLSAAAMAGGLVASYGAFALMAGRYLYPAKPLEKAWLLVADLQSIPPGGTFPYRTPGGANVTITRRGTGQSADDFLALSSTCPHLGCSVHWEGQNDRFFCPCHNGVFDPAGQAVSGPPADAGQSLPRYALKVEGELLFIEVPVEGIVRRSEPEENRLT